MEFFGRAKSNSAIALRCKITSGLANVIAIIMSVKFVYLPDTLGTIIFFLACMFQILSQYCGRWAVKNQGIRLNYDRQMDSLSIVSFYVCTLMFGYAMGLFFDFEQISLKMMQDTIQQMQGQIQEIREDVNEIREDMNEMKEGFNEKFDTLNQGMNVIHNNMDSLANKFDQLINTIKGENDQN